MPHLFLRLRDGITNGKELQNSPQFIKATQLRNHPVPALNIFLRSPGVDLAGQSSLDNTDLAIQRPGLSWRGAGTRHVANFLLQNSEELREVVCARVPQRQGYRNVRY